MSFLLLGNQSTSCLAGHTTVSLSDGIHFPECKMAAFLLATYSLCTAFGLGSSENWASPPNIGTEHGGNILYLILKFYTF